MKKGFTLIEVMVVIVIVGILAAVAIPNLFSNTAKAKVSEIPIAAATYIKLQDIHVGAHHQVGNWSAIGYEKPGSSYFNYDGGDLASNTSVIEVSDLDENGKIGWRATNVVGLGGCSQGNVWLVTTAKDAGKSLVTHKTSVTSQECLALTSGWSIASSGVVSTKEPEKTESPKLSSDPTDPFSKVSEEQYAAAYANIKNISAGTEGLTNIMKKQNSWDKGSDYYSQYGFENYIANISGQNESNMRTMMKQNNSNVSASDNIRTITQLLSDVETPTPGVVYAATTGLYYGNNSKGLTLYDSREVYAKMSQEPTKENYTVWDFYEDKDCTKPIGHSTTNNVDFWKKEQQ